RPWPLSRPDLRHERLQAGRGDRRGDRLRMVTIPRERDGGAPAAGSGELCAEGRGVAQEADEVVELGTGHAQRAEDALRRIESHAEIDQVAALERRGPAPG